ncbi:MAG: hypothetical protein WAN86_12965, partial [Hyphomicrobiaceae bacterium]
PASFVIGGLKGANRASVNAFTRTRLVARVACGETASVCDGALMVLLWPADVALLRVLLFFYFQYFIHRGPHFHPCIHREAAYQRPTCDGLVIERTEMPA